MSGVDPFLWTPGKVLVDIDSSPIGVLLAGRSAKQVCV